MVEIEEEKKSIEEIEPEHLFLKDIKPYSRKAQILRILLKEKRPTSRKELMRRVKMSSTYLCKCTTQLAQEGKIRKILKGREIMYTTEPEGSDYQAQTYTRTEVIIGMIPELKTFLKKMKVEDNRSDLTIRGYAYKIVDFYRFLHGFDKPRFAVTKITAITKNDLRRYFNYCFDELHHGEHTRYNTHAILKAYFHFCAVEEYIKQDPMIYFKAPKIEKKHKPSFTEEEFNKMVEASKDFKDKAILYLLFATGARVSEIVRLNLEDIDWEKKEVKLLIKKLRTKEKTPTPIAPIALEALSDYIHKARGRSRNPEDSTVFLNNRKTRLSSRGIEKIITRICKEAGIRHYSPHSFRRACGKLMLEGHADVRIVQEQLHHKNIQTTITYTEVTNEFHVQEYKSAHPLLKTKEIAKKHLKEFAEH